MKNHRAPGLSRRRFLAAASTITAPMIVPAAVLGRNGSVAPSERILAGCIGMGSRGSGHANEIAAFPDTQVVATCDVFRSKAEQVRQRIDERYASLRNTGSYRNCTACQDFRELLARPDIDAVTIASPENWHAVMAVEAMKAGKDVYCEKALSLTVAEGRAVCEAARRYGRVFQAGTQQRSDPRFRFACELARNGYLGTVKKVWVGVPGGRALPILPVKPVPEDLDYDLWLGPAQSKPYRDGLCTYNWYFVSDYCAGWIQSWGVHHVDIALWGVPALTAATLEVAGTATFPDEGTADCSFAWHTTLSTPDGIVLDFCDDRSATHGHGCRFEGDQGWVHVVRGGIRAEPASLLDVVIKPGEQRLYASRHHMGNFVECIRSRRDPAAPVEAVHAATTATLIADIATRLGRKLTWDWPSERFLNDDAANRMLSRALRHPWHV